MDDADYTQDRIDLEIWAAIKEISERTVIPEGTGFCYYCDGPVEAPRRWCDASCRDGWEKEKAPGQRGG